MAPERGSCDRLVSVQTSFSYMSLGTPLEGLSDADLGLAHLKPR
jgi:hypothetical protein